MGAVRSQIQELSGWGRFPVERCHVFRPEKRTELVSILVSGIQPTYISRGLGRSYGDAALNRDSGVISHTRLNRFLSFDASAGLLECEAGVSFREIVEHFLPRGFFPPVTPGTKFVTLGGAIAADVHGKNHHCDGTIANFIHDFQLLAPTGELLTCSPRENADAFWATIGGMGLTGIILSARMGLRRVETSYVSVDYQKAEDLEAALAAFAETDAAYQYSVAWIDCLAAGKALGRALLIRGNHAKAGALPSHIRQPLGVPRRTQWNVPWDFPSGALTPFSARAFNALYYASHRNAANQIAHFESFFYPLDRIHNWNRIYGRRGFVQYQAALPLDGGRAGLLHLLERLRKSGRSSFLAVLKRLGKSNPGLISFPREGYTLALDLPVQAGLADFLHELDAIVLRHGGRVYLAKDSALHSDSFAAMYPKLGEFRAIRERLDPKRVLSSSLARRIGIDRRSDG